MRDEPPRPPLPSPLPDGDEGDPLSDELLTPDEARALVRASSGRAPTGLRNRALVAVMYRSGLRPGEALALLPADVDLGAATVDVPARKGGSRRVTGIDATTRGLIAAWLERRRERGIAHEAPLFCTLAGEPLKAAYVRELLPRLARRAGIRKRVHPLALRYANAAELAEEGMPAATIDRHLGIAPVGGARRYRRPVADVDVAAAVAAREWRL
ncbi:tyrosine-type recombinase/integrase [Miltoncostaea marina]|uniref:tyrosine-type recombinase/integrase n=1 Tax=Miltoncostaea marina TaxID=2843215 RepID=UPI001C3C37E1|nr:tyrosine-type recombinase/integrase [Miltoncostaea marina]